MSQIFSLMGYLSVSVFFFLSGYGLMSGYEKKGIEYAKGMLLHRIIPFYIVSLCLSYIDMIGTLSFSIKRVLLTPIAFGDYGYLWYLEVQLFIYVLFAIIFSFHVSDELKLSLFFGGIMLMVVGLCAIGMGGWWYNSVICVFIGIIWKRQQNEIDGYILNRRGYWIALPLAFLLFCGLTVSRYFTGNIYILVAYLSAVAFVLLVIVAIMIFPYENKVTYYLGTISLEIYALQHIFVSAFHSNVVNVENPWIYCLIVYGATIIAASVVHPFIQRFMSMKCWRK